MKRGRPPHDDILTPREWQVLALLAERRTNPEIAAQLGITTDGVKYHVSQILAKLGVESREEAGRLYRTHRPKQPAVLGALSQLRWLLPRTAVALTVLGGSIALVVLVVLFSSSNGGTNRGTTRTDDPSRAVGLDVPPDKDPGAAANPTQALPNTLLLTKGTPANTGSGAATIAAMHRVGTVAELEAALTDSTKLIVIDRGALDEVRGSNFLRRQLEAKRIIMGLNISNEEIAALSDFQDMVSGGCAAGCADYPGIRAPSMPERGFYSYQFIDRNTADPVMFMGQGQVYFFEEVFNEAVAGLDRGHYDWSTQTALAPKDLPSERISVNRGMGCIFDDAKTAEAAKQAVIKEFGDHAVAGVMIIFCNRESAGIRIGILAHPALDPNSSYVEPCLAPPGVTPATTCTPQPRVGPSSTRNIQVVVPESSLLP